LEVPDNLSQQEKNFISKVDPKVEGQGTWLWINQLPANLKKHCRGGIFLPRVWLPEICL
jgi:hypothetical protein